ncbi:hypothetical protein D3C78_1090620 [compost metagenome]
MCIDRRTRANELGTAVGGIGRIGLVQRRDQEPDGGFERCGLVDIAGRCLAQIGIFDPVVSRIVLA